MVSFTHNRPDRAAGVTLKLRATSHSCYVMRCVRPGRVLGMAGPHLRPMGRAGPDFRPDRFGFAAVLRNFSISHSVTDGIRTRSVIPYLEIEIILH